MTHWLSKPVESLLWPTAREREDDRSPDAPAPELDVDTLIVGSGYGAAMAALALADAPEGERGSIWVFERGGEYVPGEFPKTIGDLPGHVSVVTDGERQGRADALWDIRVGDGVSAVVGSGLGGTSLVNAGVALPPTEASFASWPAPPGDGRGDDWLARLAPSIDFVERLLETRTHPRASELAKYVAFERTAKALGATAEPAPVAVHFEGERNRFGVCQSPCIDCGNCVTGCNIGAKNTLPMNAWPLAHAMGVELFTGANVHSLLPRGPNDARWKVRVRLTRDGDEVNFHFFVLARRVILAAGTFGSTEILMRSRDRGNLTVSRELGRRFSVNGDAITFGYGAREAVHAAARVASVADEPGSVDDEIELDSGPPIGPTIVGWAKLGPEGTTLEDGAAPYALTRLWGELLSTQALLRRFADGAQPAWLDAKPDHDPIAVSDDLLEHCQVLLAMGREEPLGHLEPDALGMHARPIRKAPAKPNPDGHFAALHRRLRAAEAAGFGGGHYVPNPLWKAVPDDFEDVFEGTETIPSHHLTVHPLGGCVMGVDAWSGVVDVRGQVFNGEGADDVHEDLYVLDGAIIPGPLGVNPFLSIAALAHHLACGIAAHDRTGEALLERRAEKTSPPAASGYPIPDPHDCEVSGTFRERLALELGGDSRERQWLTAELGFAPDAKKLVLDVEIELADVFRRLQQPDFACPACFRISQDVFGGTNQTTPSAHLEPLAKLPGTVNLGVLDRPGPLRRWWRAFGAILRFWRLRRDDICHEVRAALGRLQGGGDGAPRHSLFEMIRGYVRIARLHAEWREMVYECAGDVEVPERPVRRLTFRGRKVLAYSRCQPGVIDALCTLPFTMAIDPAQGRGDLRSSLAVDLIRLSEGPAPLQVERSPDTPTTLVAMIGFGLYFLRAIVQTHFWTFGAPSYDAYGTRDAENAARLRPPPPVIDYPGPGSERLISRHKQEFRRSWPRDAVSPDPFLARLVRYRPAEEHAAPEKAPVLLIHGGAPGSRLYWCDTVPVSLAQHLLAGGYDVWMIDFRTSPNLVDVPPPASFDAIAREELAWAVREIHEVTGRRVNVFTHCMGCASFAIAVLSGEYDGEDGSLVESAVLHGITPWLSGSPANRVRANVFSLIKDLDYFGWLDPIPHRDPDFLDLLFDRLGSAIEWGEERRRHTGDERGAGFSRATCNRMTLFWGREWCHEHLHERTHRESESLLGPVPTGLLRQAYFCIHRGQVTDDDGANRYIRSCRFRKFWTFPTLFIHGDANDVFDIQSAHDSAARLKAVLDGELGDDAPNVAFKRVRGYGHLDLLLGEHAGRDVFRWITDFFENPQEMDVPESLPAHHGRRLPTGPIVSRPGVETVWKDGVAVQRSILRLWVESSDFTSDLPASLDVQTAKGTLDWVRPPGSRPEAEWRSVFWIGDLDVTGLEAPVQMQAVHEDDPDGLHAHAKYPYDWAATPWFRRTFGGAGEQATLSFLLGSCLYPGVTFEQRLSDEVFRGMRKHVEDAGERRGVDHVLLLGDQIYADATAELFDPVSPYERFRDRYRRAFGGAGSHVGRAAHEVFANVPTYFAIDDHEVKNDWGGLPMNKHTPSWAVSPMRERYQRSLAIQSFGGNFAAARAVLDLEAPVNAAEEEERRRAEREFDIARREASNFLMHHDGAAAAPAPAGPPRLWYCFERAGVPFFVFDTRTRREPDVARGESTAIVDGAQLAAFETWLEEKVHPGRPAFIASGTPLSPIPRAYVDHPSLLRRCDRLVGFPGFVGAVHEALVEHASGARLVWLSGDLHLSSVARVRITDGTDDVDLWDVCASGLFAPVPFINECPTDYDWSRVALDDDFKGGDFDLEIGNHLRIQARQWLLTRSPQHFVRVDCGDALYVQAFDRDGQGIESRLAAPWPPGGP